MRTALCKRLPLKTLVFDQNEITYDGTQLAPHWIYKKFDLLGNALVAFIGPGTVSLDHMVDITDVKKKAPIYSPKMLHFLAEFFIDSFDQGILMQHLRSVILKVLGTLRGHFGLHSGKEPLKQCIHTLVIIM